MITFDGKYQYENLEELLNLEAIKRDALANNNQQLYQETMNKIKIIFQREPVSIEKSDWNLIDDKSKELFCNLKMEECEALGKNKDMCLKELETLSNSSKIDKVMQSYIDEKRAKVEELSKEAKEIKESPNINYDSLSLINIQLGTLMDEISRVIVLKSVPEEEKEELRKLLQLIDERKREVPVNSQEESLKAFG